MAMKLAKSEALKTIECFGLEMKQSNGYRQRIGYLDGGLFMEQGDVRMSFSAMCMEELRLPGIYTDHGQCDYREKALLGKGAKGSHFSASSKAEVLFCLGTSLSFSKTTGCQSNKSSLMSSIK